MTLGSPPYPVRGGCTRLLFLAEDETRTREGNASITCNATIASAPRDASSISARSSREKEHAVPLRGKKELG